MNQYSEHYWKIERYKQNFERMLELIQNECDFEKKLSLAEYAANYFVYNSGCYFTSSILEKVFVDFAQKIKVDLSNIKYKEKSVLHVLTRGYETGGHTRVVERWIENAPAEQMHSVIQTEKAEVDLNTLKNNVKVKNGEYIVFENNLSLEEKAKELRKLGMKYEYIILHTHMEDPIATIAFGTEEFTRPVFLYNHASHRPWIGKSVADLVLDIENNDPVTREKRGIKNTYFLGVPSKEISITIPNKEEVRKKLHLPVDKKIIVTSGGEIRYRNIAGKSFFEFLTDIMDDDTCCYVIGVKPDNVEWQKAIISSKKDIKLMGFIDFNNGFLEYLKAADLYLDSYPLGGGTAVIDAISSGTPALSLKSVYPQFDYLTSTSAYCQTGEEFIDKAKQILDDKDYAKEMLEEEKKSLIEYQSIDAWNKKVENLYKTAPKTHKVKYLSNVDDYSEPNDLSVLSNVLYGKNFLNLRKIKIMSTSEIYEAAKYGYLYKKIGIPFIFQKLSFKKQGKKIKIFKLFGIKIFEYEK